MSDGAPGPATAPGGRPARVGRDPEAERYELQAQREQHQELGRALYERRRPDSPKTWLELSEDDRVEWILLAVDHADQERARVVTTGTTATVDAQVQAHEQAVDTDAQAQAVGRLAGALQRVWMSGKPFEPGGGINWTEFAKALTDEGVRA